MNSFVLVVNSFIIQGNVKEILQKPADFYDARGRLDPDGFDQHVQFHTYAPPADLSLFIEHFWTIRWDKADDMYSSE
jgi:hypothetical protein